MTWRTRCGCRRCSTCSRAGSSLDDLDEALRAAGQRRRRRILRPAAAEENRGTDRKSGLAHHCRQDLCRRGLARLTPYRGASVSGRESPVSREEDDAVALVRVYCGLASADPADRPASAGSTLTSAVVDDAGRLLARLRDQRRPGRLRPARSRCSWSGRAGRAARRSPPTATTTLVTSLLTAAGPSTGDRRRRLGRRLRRAVRRRRLPGGDAVRRRPSGAPSAWPAPCRPARSPRSPCRPPADLAGYKQVLAAHAALASGRHSAAVALREVLRELYPAALRAYPDPAEPVAAGRAGRAARARHAERHRRPRPRRRGRRRGGRGAARRRRGRRRRRDHRTR